MLPSVNRNKKNYIFLFLEQDKFPVLFYTVPLTFSRTRGTTVHYRTMDCSQYHVRWVGLAKTGIPFRQRFSYLLIPNGWTLSALCHFWIYLKRVMFELRDIVEFVEDEISK